ncbi:YeiH family protein [Roseovarius atlanticus]|uniref:YeiH family protein n=1 Tax=Roseovarius atlanticus TaxID=1641875 RepID=UPI001C98AC79|nr:YeiH family protein [Roseovarius atlanticus]MBY5987522.1 YeiH family protein [Roseovarius atlanticus]MBY6122913.1 YeiH family protein [Roseovarius atlanticus]MBY6147409.1 YeiH family protein [Roseovarius atlanticus]
MQTLSQRAHAGSLQDLYAHLPGLALVMAITGIATLVQRATGLAALSPLVVALLLGIGWRVAVGSPPSLQPGIRFALKPVLRVAIVLLGLQVTVGEVSTLGLRGIVAVTTTLAATFAFTCLLGRLLGVESRLVQLIAAGTSVCGASAVLACNTVTRGSDEDVAYAIACVTLFGTSAMLLGPMAAHMLELTPETYGFWAGATVHEVAQVVGAAFAMGEEAGHVGTVTKLTRVLLLAPLILTLGVLQFRRGGQRALGSKLTIVPWFVLGFVILMGINSMVNLPDRLHDATVTLTALMLTAALAAMGLETDLRRLRQKGLRPLVLGGAAWIFIATLGLGLSLWAMAG